MLSQKTRQTFSETVEKVKKSTVEFENKSYSTLEAVKLTGEIRGKAFNKFTALTAELRELVQKDLKNSGCSDIVFSGSFTLDLYISYILQKIIIRTIDECDDSIFERLISLAASDVDNFEYYEITPIWGITIKEPIVINQNIKLINTEQLPDSPQRQDLLNFTLSDQFFQNAPFSPPATAIVVKKKITRKDIRENYKNVDFFNDNIKLALVALIPSAIWEHSYWTEFTDPDINTLVMKADKAKPTIDIVPSFTRSREIKKEDFDSVITYLKKYLNLNKDTKNKINIALSRLNNALKRKDTGDCAIELGIALESLLSGDEKSEITDRDRVRGSKFLGGDLQEKSKNSDILKHCYSIRSEMVHNGSLKENKMYSVGHTEKMDGDSICREASKICAALIRKIVDQGNIPNWPEFDIN